MRFVAFLIFLLAAGPAFAKTATLSSPDGKIVVTVTDEGGEAGYSIAYDGAEVVRRSKLGLLFKDRAGFDRDLAIAGETRAERDETWEQPWGERRFVADRHNELAVEFAHQGKPAQTMIVRLRAFNDGVGFRYEVSEQKTMKGALEIIDELTEFAIPDERETDAWWIPGRRYNRYEYLYHTTKLDDVMMAHTPMTMRLSSGVHLSIHEAAVVDYGAFVLDQQRPGVLQADVTPWSDGVKVKTKAPFKSPWRTIQISPDAKGLLNSDLILNLNEPNALGDVSWVETGKYVGIWWGMHINDNTWGSGPHHGATTEEAKKYIDFAAEHGFIGVLVEGWNEGWDGDWYSNGEVFNFTKAYPDFDIEEVTRYAAEKGVRLIGHHETSGHVTNYERQLADALDLYERLGVNAVKTGYVADAGRIQRVDENGLLRYEWHDGQFQAGHHLRVVREAARRKIAVNPHEPIKDTGLRRTYPNWITREGARGMEFNAWGDPPNPPEHEAMLAFTRMLSGPMDFTPGIFDLEPSKKPDVSAELTRHSEESRIKTTLAKQLALYVVLYSPIQMAADLPENYEARPDAFQFIKDVPADWEESIGLAGEVGDFVVFARKERGGEDWYLGAVTDEEAREVSVSLDFLDGETGYRAEIYRDGPKADWRDRPYEIVIEEKTVRAGETLKLSLAPGGGTAIRFTPLQ